MKHHEEMNPRQCNDKGIFSQTINGELEQLHEQRDDDFYSIAIGGGRDIFLTVGHMTVAHESVQSGVTTGDEGRESQC